MKVSEQWLREYGHIALEQSELLAMLPMAGLEVDAVLAVGKDHHLELDLTPNRGDCLSVLGLSREINALQKKKFTPAKIPAIAPQLDDVFPVKLLDPKACPRYVGRVIKNVDISKPSPLWMQERLKASGMQSIDAVVDVTNYVMLELGQPLHAFDLATLKQEIRVRFAKSKEKLTLLSGETIELTDDCLVISDAKGPLAFAGILGGVGSGISETTKDLFLESAFFAPEVIVGRARRYGLHTESSHRFERGVDPQLQERAIERATQLLLEIVGGNAGPMQKQEPAEMTTRIVTLRPSRLQRVLGFTIPDEDVVVLLQALGMTVFAEGDSWIVQVPSYRFDIRIEVDLIEEVARLYGYHRIPSEMAKVTLETPMIMEDQLSKEQLSDQLVALGYREAITYSFVSPTIQSIIMPHAKGKVLLNPISAELSEMRTSLWPGLLNAVLYNQSRQMSRVKLFEVGLRFFPEAENRVQQDRMLAGVVSLSNIPEQWGQKNVPVDYYDMKADVESLMQMSGLRNQFHFESGTHPALHPEQSANIVRQDQIIGHLGVLHPEKQKQLQLKGPVVLFELMLAGLSRASVPSFKPISKYPAVRRDLACVAQLGVTAAQLKDCIRKNGNENLQNVEIFDVYSGEGVEDGEKSVAIGLTMQHSSRTLTDVEVNGLVESIIKGLANGLGVKLRERT